MTAPAEPVRRRDWWLRPGVMLPILASALVLVMLLTPEQATGRLGDDRLSAHLAGSLGARALHDVAARFGWRAVMRDDAPVPSDVPGATVHAVLAPRMPPNPAQSHRYMEAVRAGDGLLFVMTSARTPLGDSLGVRLASVGGVLITPRPDSAGCGKRGRDFMPTLWPDARVHLYGLRWVRGRPAEAVDFALLNAGGRSGVPTEAAATGVELGRGRVIVVSDPDLLRNDVIRRCAWGTDAIAMRMLEWLRAGGDVPRNTLEFDEYHQGFGPRPSTTSVTERFLTGHPVGRAILALVLAALVLLLAVAPRAIMPRLRARVERRDPLEQADALAHAYQQVNATRTATHRLVRALRSRVERAGRHGRTDDDDDFLAAAAAADPALAADVAMVILALHAQRGSASLPDVGAALRRIEGSLTTTTISPA